MSIGGGRRMHPHPTPRLSYESAHRVKDLWLIAGSLGSALLGLIVVVVAIAIALVAIAIALVLGFLVGVRIEGIRNSRS